MSITRTLFGTLPGGRPVDCYTIENQNGARAEILTYGGTLNRLYMPDRNGVLADVLIGFDTLEGHLKYSDYQGKAGESGYTLSKLLGLWFNGFTAFSEKPLRVATMIGTGCAFLGFLYGLYTIIKKLVNPMVPIGFSSLMSALMFI